jgi:hypothetical protein
VMVKQFLNNRQTAFQEIITVFFKKGVANFILWIVFFNLVGCLQGARQKATVFLDETVVPTWNEKVVPTWKEDVVPTWNEDVVPTWNEKVSPKIDDIVAVVQKQLNELYKQSGGMLSDLVGDPKEQKKAYQDLAGRCSNAIGPIDNAAKKTGISGNYLLILAYQESSCNPKAQAGTSSAAGMFQFVEYTWLVSLNKYGGKYGYEKYADNISLSSNGTPKVADNAQKRKILNLRLDPDLSALMAAELALDNRRYLERKVKRKLSATDLYLAHFLGAHGASNFIVEMERNPSKKADLLFPAAARCNRTIFYSSGSGAPRSLADIYNYFEKKIRIS